MGDRRALGRAARQELQQYIFLVLAPADRMFALERGTVFHEGPAAPLLTDLDYRKKILWL